ncbi:glycosyltransferase family 39 protein [Candidatus Daviesbacteria bacterium]|nr:glycosyltransferase family 39 protein [Candidatus Daviesbacteria bacterium]
MAFSRILPLTAIFLIFFTLFVFLSIRTMTSVPFYDFDEAHRAENAKRMKEYKSFFVPLTGSSYDRVEHLKIPFRENGDFYLYYHLERPPLIYILMFISTTIFGDVEWAYRLPSFLFGILTIACLIFFIKKETGNIFAISIGLLSLITSADLWLSSQYAQMDTGITFFLTASLLTLIYFVQSRKTFLIFLSGIFFGFALLSKLQPAVIFIFPLIGLLILRKIHIADLFKFGLGFLIIFLPWMIHLIVKFGITDAIRIMPGFALTSASIINIHQKAPIFWYMRWWWDSFRPGWTIFLGLLIFDIVSKNLNWKKITLLFYIFGGLLSFSIAINKIWWYVLPLIPAICYYIFLSVNDYIQNEKKALDNLSFTIVVASLPIFLRSSNLISMIYGISITTIVFLILKNKLSIKINPRIKKQTIFYIVVAFSLLLFSLQFPKITPYHRNVKEVALYYKNLSYPKCLWLGDMPGEAVLFYSNAGEVPPLNQTNQTTQIFSNCKDNFLITPERYNGNKPIISRGSIRLYQLTKDSKWLSE